MQVEPAIVADDVSGPLQALEAGAGGRGIAGQPLPKVQRWPADACQQRATGDEVAVFGAAVAQQREDDGGGAAEQQALPQEVHQRQAEGEDEGAHWSVSFNSFSISSRSFLEMPLRSAASTSALAEPAKAFCIRSLSKLLCSVSCACAGA